jgi:hypothetical protein
MRNGDAHTLLMLIKHDVMVVSDEVKAYKAEMADMMRTQFHETRQAFKEMQSSVQPSVQKSGQSELSFQPPNSSCNNKDGPPQTLFATSAGLQPREAWYLQPRGPTCSPALAIDINLESAVDKIRLDLEDLQKQLAREDPKEAARALSSLGQPQMQRALQVGGQGGLDRSFQLASLPPQSRVPTYPVRDQNPSTLLSCCDGPERRAATRAQIIHQN